MAVFFSAPQARPRSIIDASGCGLIPTGSKKNGNSGQQAPTRPKFHALRAKRWQDSGGEMETTGQAKRGDAPLKWKRPTTLGNTNLAIIRKAEADRPP